LSQVCIQAGNEGTRSVVNTCCSAGTMPWKTMARTFYRRSHRCH